MADAEGDQPGGRPSLKILITLIAFNGTQHDQGYQEFVLSMLAGFDHLALA